MLNLHAAGSDPKEAISQSQEDFLNAMKLALDVERLPDFSEMSVYNLDDSNELGNAFLLAVSVSVYQLATDKSQQNNSRVSDELTQLMENLRADFKDDGMIAQTLIASIASASKRVDTNKVVDNLKKYSIDAVYVELDVPDFASIILIITIIPIVIL